MINFFKTVKKIPETIERLINLQNETIQTMAEVKTEIGLSHKKFSESFLMEIKKISSKLDVISGSAASVDKKLEQFLRLNSELVKNMIKLTELDIERRKREMTQEQEQEEPTEFDKLF